MRSNLNIKWLRVKYYSKTFVIFLSIKQKKGVKYITPEKQDK